MLILLLFACTKDADVDSQPDSVVEVDCSEYSLELPSPRKEISGVWDAER